MCDGLTRDIISDYVSYFDEWLASKYITCNSSYFCIQLSTKWVVVLHACNISHQSLKHRTHVPL